MKATAIVSVLSSGIYRATVTCRAACMRAVGATPSSAIRSAVADLRHDGHRVRSVKVDRADIGEEYVSNYVGRTFATEGGSR